MDWLKIIIPLAHWFGQGKKSNAIINTLFRILYIIIIIRQLSLHHIKYMQPMKCPLIRKITPTHAWPWMLFSFIYLFILLNIVFYIYTPTYSLFSNAKVRTDSQKEPTSWSLGALHLRKRWDIYIYIYIYTYILSFVKKESGLVLLLVVSLTPFNNRDGNWNQKLLNCMRLQRIMW